MGLANRRFIGDRVSQTSNWEQMINAVLDIKLLAPEEWHVLRSTRLRALRESPKAFTSRYETEARWSEAQWRQRLAAATWLVAMEGGAVIGIAGLIDGRHHEGRYVESIWVSPTHRRRRVFRSLAATLADVGRRMELRELVLWVLEDNASALIAYARVGFVPTGERQPIRPGHGSWERRMRLAL